MNRLIDRRTLAPVCASLILLLCTFNLSCSSNPCAPVFQALEKLKGRTFHSFVSYDLSNSSESIANNNEGIQVGGISYWKDHGKWSIIDSDDRKFNSDRIKFAASISCRLEDAEFLDGEGADHYVTHGTWKDDVNTDVHGQFWVSQSTGLIMRANFKFNAGGLVRGTASLRWEYANVSAPIVSK